MTPNSFYIKLTGKANIPEPLELGNGYTVHLQGEVVSSADVNNQDGTFDRIFSFRSALCEIVDDKGRVVRAKDMRKRSEQLRFVVKRLWEQDGANGIDHEEAYDRFMKHVITNAERLYMDSKK